MKNTVITLILVAISSMMFSQNKTLKAFYQGYDEAYVFSDVEDETYEFATVSASVLKQFKLKDESSEGEAFLITYNVKIIKDEDGDDTEVYHIVSLKSIQLERVDPDYNYDDEE